MDETTPTFICDVDDTIRIGDDITLTLTSVHPGQAKFGINAPKGVAIERLENKPHDSLDQ